MKATRRRPRPVNIAEGRPPVRQSTVVTHLLQKYADQPVPVHVLTRAYRHAGEITVEDIDKWAAEVEARPELQDRGTREPVYRGGYVPRTPSVVYYMLFNGLVKIGFTTNLTLRMQSIPHDELLVTEAGGPQLERIRHSEFRALHYRGEWFRYEGPLVDHVARLRAA